MSKSSVSPTDGPFAHNPIILFESHTDPITVDLLRAQLETFVAAGYTAICLEQPESSLEVSIRELQSRLPFFDAVIEDIESGSNTYISEHVRNTYKEHAADFERQFKLGMEHKILLYEAILQFQNSHDGIPKIYAIDTGIETQEDLIELVEIYRTNDFDNPNFNLIRDKAFARNLAEIYSNHAGGAITIMGLDHFGLQRELLGVLAKEQALQIKSFYHHSFDKNDSEKFGGSIHSIGLKSGDVKSLQRYPLGIEVIDYSIKDKLDAEDYMQMSSTVLEKTEKSKPAKRRM